MNMRAILVILVAVTQCACTSMEWVKSDATPEQRSDDLQVCQQEAWRAAQLYDWYYRPAGATVIGRDFLGRPYVYPRTPFYDPFTDPQMEEARLTNFCMKSKGYELKAVEKDKKEKQ